MITRDQLQSLLLDECAIINHLYTKIPADLNTANNWMGIDWKRPERPTQVAAAEAEAKAS